MPSFESSLFYLVRLILFLLIEWASARKPIAKFDIAETKSLEAILENKDLNENIKIRWDRP